MFLRSARGDTHSFYLVTEGGSIVTLFKMLLSDPRQQSGILWYRWLNSSWQRILRGDFPGSRVEGSKKSQNSRSIPGQEEFHQWHHRIPGWWRGPLINIFNSSVQHVGGRQRDQWCSSWRKLCPQSVRKCPAKFPPRATTTTNQSSPVILKLNDSRADSKYRKEGGCFAFWNGLCQNVC